MYSLERSRKSKQKSFPNRKNLISAKTIKMHQTARFSDKKKFGGAAKNHKLVWVFNFVKTKAKLRI